MALPRIAVSLGDPSGIGPEVTARALASVWGALSPVVYGDAAVWRRACAAVGETDPLVHVKPGQPLPAVPCLVETTALGPLEGLPGHPDAAGARAQLAFLTAAVEAVERGECEALCTAPLSKAQVASTGLSFSGHTEFLAERAGRRVLMMLAGKTLRVALATTHLPIAKVPAALETGRLADDLVLLSNELARWGVVRARIAVCGLNPHAGEDGLLGTEERDVIRPAVVRAQGLGVRAEGPFAADSLFPKVMQGGRYDAVYAMFHDQGLVALKLVHFWDGVNVTLGLPYRRTSPDHGVAYDIAGQGKADARSMVEALRWAAGGKLP
jgi:4-hydroxythreonine-4-phosphate dehydrogenase